MEKPMTTNDKFLASMKKKHETKEVDKPKVEKATMKGILGDITQVPEMLNMTGSPDRKSAKPKKAQENVGNTGKQEFPSTMDKSY